MREFTEEQWAAILEAAGPRAASVQAAADAAQEPYEPAANVVVEGADAPVDEQTDAFEGESDEAGE